MSKEIIYSMDGVPLLNNYVYATADEAVKCATGNIRLTQDLLTGIVHNEAYVPEIMTYDEGYQNEQANSEVFVEHLEQVRLIIVRHFRNRSILEVGCGKGTFLELLRSHHFCIVGVDPAYQGNCDYIIKAPFSTSLGISGDAVILRHVLEHIYQPVRFLRSIQEANKGKGLIFIEVPCLDWIREHRACFDVYYEHVNYFRLADFHCLFERVLESGSLFGGQYIYVVADLASLRIDFPENVSEFRFPPDFFGRFDDIVNSVRNGRIGKKIIWGAASKGVVFSLLLQRRGEIVPDFAIDINPTKQGKFLPITGLPILAPSDGLSKLGKGDLVFVMNSNYYHEIRAIGGSQLSYFKVD